ncbi:MAG: ATP synthase F1 subunit delta [Thermoanaerobaculia bacterium]
MTPIARRYAHAFLEAAAGDDAVERFLEEVRAVERAVAENRALRAFLDAPTIPAAAKSSALAELGRRAGLDEFGRRFLDLVLRNRRIRQLPEILAGLSEAFDAKRGVVAARVTVAAPIGDAERARIEAALGRRTGRKVRMQVAVDPGVLAGFVARVGSEVFDASAVQAIERFRMAAKEKAGA